LRTGQGSVLKQGNKDLRSYVELKQA